MKKLAVSVPVLVFVSLMLVFYTVFALPSSSKQLNTDALDEVIITQMAKHGLPGVAVIVIDSGEVVYQKGYGYDGNGDPMTPNTLVYIGSQSKSFTAMAIAQLAEQGRIDLSAPVQTYIPWFRVADETASKEITINHLLHHTSGLSDAGFSKVLPLDTGLEDAVRSLSAAKLTAPVGKKFQYFNLGYTVLAYLVELESGMSYAEYVQENILTPLDMTSSTADPSTAADMPKGFTRFFGFAVPARERYPVYGVGAGWIVSNAVDMGKYADEFLTNDRQLVSDQMMSKILSPGIGSYGMGWFIYDNGTKIIHGGANLTFRTEVYLYPKIDRAFVILTNEGYQMDHFISAGQLRAGVEAVVLGRTPPAVDQGWSVRWIGWAVGVLVIGLVVLHTRNFLALRSWKKRMRGAPGPKKIWDVSISFLIPIIITTVVFWQLSNFYGDRFNLIPSLVFLRQGMPDIFLLMIVGILPDLIQGIVKIILLIGMKRGGPGDI